MTTKLLSIAAGLSLALAGVALGVEACRPDLASALKILPNPMHSRHPMA